jgi:predicted DNA-binding protein
MTNQEKRLKQLEAKLKGENTGVILGAMNVLRNVKPLKGVIRLLAELYNVTQSAVIRKNIEELMNDMKESSLREEVVAEIKKEYKPETIRMLVSSCWQSGLDYSPYVSDFAMIFTLCDYETAIECFTVIEGCAPQITRKTRDHMIIILKENEEIRATDKFSLMAELVAVLS